MSTFKTFLTLNVAIFPISLTLSNNLKLVDSFSLKDHKYDQMI